LVFQPLGHGYPLNSYLCRNPCLNFKRADSTTSLQKYSIKIRNTISVQKILKISTYLKQISWLLPLSKQLSWKGWPLNVSDECFEKPFKNFLLKIFSQETVEFEKQIRLSIRIRLFLSRRILNILWIRNC